MNTAQPDSNMIKCIANIVRLISVHSVIETTVQVISTNSVSYLDT